METLKEVVSYKSPTCDFMRLLCSILRKKHPHTLALTSDLKGLHEWFSCATLLDVTPAA